MPGLKPDREWMAARADHRATSGRRFTITTGTDQLRTALNNDRRCSQRQRVFDQLGLPARRYAVQALPESGRNRFCGERDRRRIRQRGPHRDDGTRLAECRPSAEPHVRDSRKFASKRAAEAFNVINPANFD